MNESDFNDPPPTTQRAGSDAPLLDEELELRVIAGPDRGASIALDSGTCVVGKVADCALRLTDPEVSRTHLELRVETCGVLVRDLGSKNGSFYRGARITEVLLGSGAVV